MDIKNGLIVRSVGDVDKKVQVKIVDFTNPTLGATILADGRIETKANLFDENGVPFSSSNPLPVYVSDNEGSELHDYNAAVAVASNASIDHTYTNATNVVKVKGLVLSASGEAKFDILVGPTGSEVAKFTFFVEDGFKNAAITLPSPLTLNIGDNLIVRKYNRDDDPQDIYSTIVGDII